MKKLIALVALLGFAASVHADGAEFSHNADMRIRYKSDKAKDWAKEGSTSTSFDQRLRWGTTFRKGDKLTGHLGLVHAGTWGHNQSQTPSDIASDNTTDTADTRFSVTGTENLLLVNEAYMTWMANDEFSIKAGRGAATIADGRVVAKNKYENVHKAFDGMLFNYDADFGKVAYFFARGNDDYYTGGFKNDPKGDFSGFLFDFKNLPDALKTAHVHYIMVNQDPGTGAQLGANQTRLGLTLGGDVSGIDYNFTYAKLGGKVVGVDGKDATGTDSEYDSSMMDLTVGYSMPDTMNLRLSFQYHTDTGNKASSDAKNEAYDGFHYDEHYNAGLMDVVKYGNLTFMRLGATFDATEDVMVGFDYYTFTKSEKTDGVSINGTDNTNSTTEDAVGTEMDLTVTKKYGDDFNMAFRYGTFTPGKAVYTATTNEASHTQFLLTGTVKF